MTIGKRIRRARKKNGLSQEQLAKLLNMSRQAVAKWETDICEPNLDCLTQMAKIFGVSLDYLIAGTDSDGKEKRQIINKKDLVLLVVFTVSLLSFIGLFIYALLNPLYYNQKYSFIWWYVRFWVSSGTWFRLLVLLTLAGVITPLVLLVKKRISYKKIKLQGEKSDF